MIATVLIALTAPKNSILVGSYLHNVEYMPWRLGIFETTIRKTFIINPKFSLGRLTLNKYAQVIFTCCSCKKKMHGRMPAKLLLKVLLLFKIIHFCPSVVCDLSWWKSWARIIISISIVSRPCFLPKVIRITILYLWSDFFLPCLPCQACCKRLRES